MVKKVKQVFNEYDFSVLTPVFLILLGIICTFVFDDTDSYFIIENGKKILESGFPYTDWMSMHQDFHIVIQQWIISVIQFLLYSNFGRWAIQIFYMIVCFSFYIILWNWLRKKTNNNLLLFIIILISASIVIPFFGSARPQIFSLFFVTLSIIFCDNYSRTNNKKWLIGIPILSLLHANCHSTFWCLTIGVAGLYFLFVSIRDKKIHWVYALVMIIAILLGLANPYGYEAIIHPLYTSGYMIYSYVSELQTNNVYLTLCFIFLPAIFITILTTCRIKDHNFSKNIIPVLLLYIITTVASILFLRILMYNLVIGTILFALLTADKIERNKQLICNKKTKLEFYCLIGVLAFALCSIFYTNVNMYGVDNHEYKGLGEVKDYLLEQDQYYSDSNVLTSNISEGQYLYHYTKLHPYIDGRLETYIDSLNKKEDISTEFMRVASGKDNCQDLLNKYHFDYIVAENDSFIQDGANNSEDYELIFSSEYQNPGYNLYKRKN